jgi:hypothetical protein
MMENTVHTAKQAVKAKVLMPRAALAPGTVGAEALVTATSDLGAKERAPHHRFSAVVQAKVV